MPEEISNCPLCNHHESRLFDQRKFRDQTVINRICTNCGLVYQSPRMTADELDEFYAREYRQVYQGGEGPTKKDLFVQNGRADALLELLSSADVHPKRYLDIGSSSGILLQRFRDYFQCDVLGVEPGEAYREYAQQLGLTVFADLSELDDLGGARFDLISMAHVLEHLPDPVAYLAILREKHLTPSGSLLIEVPNLYCHDSFEIAHMTSFSEHTLRQVFSKAGYRILVLKKHGQPRSAMLPLYLTALVQPEAEPKDFEPRPERNVTLKRRLGMLWRRLLLKIAPWVPVK